MAETWILYQTTNAINGKIYVGVHKCTNTPRSRQYLGSGDKITAAIKKYGRKNFERVTLAEFACLEDAYSAEAKLVNTEFVNRKDTYNVCLGGRGGVNFTEEMKVKLSMAKKGKPRSDETKAKIGAFNRGKVTSEETKEKMRIAAYKREYKPASEETKAKKRASSADVSLPVMINGVYYTSKNFAAKVENTYISTLHNRINSNNPKWTEWRLATEEERLNYASSTL